jgi:hypothetical protein
MNKKEIESSRVWETDCSYFRREEKRQIFCCRNERRDQTLSLCKSSSLEDCIMDCMAVESRKYMVYSRKQSLLNLVKKTRSLCLTFI